MGSKERAQEILNKTGIKLGQRVITTKTAEFYKSYEDNGDVESRLIEVPKGTIATVVGAAGTMICLRSDDPKYNSNRSYGGIIDGGKLMIWRLYPTSEFRKLDLKIDKEGNLV